MKLIKFLPILFLAIGFFFFQSCEVDPCSDVLCSNGGTCVDGTCDCPDGYSGDICQTFDPCFDVTCLNDGTCVDGTCDCPDGYTGVDCSNLCSTDIVGTWNTTGVTLCGMVNIVSFTFTEGQTVDEIKMSMVWDNATYSCTGTLTADCSTYTYTLDGLTDFGGVITFNGTSLSGTYDDQVSCTFTADKQ